MDSFVYSEGESVQVHSDDGGHRYGNFHNYYNFHPPKNRIDVLQRCGIFDFIIQRFRIIDKNHLYYCDLGCNEGNLSLEVSQVLSKEQWNIKTLGLDIDTELISRARKKDGLVNIDAEFHECNLLDEQDHMARCQAFLNEKSASTQRRFDLLSVFSTTMWIHVHAGDEGLKDFIKRCCHLSDMILMEPQPSKCYKDINVRLRKLNRPEVDVSIKRLKLRGSIGDEIEQIMIECGFERIKNSQKPSSNTVPNNDSFTTLSSPTTEWNRTLYLYVRMDLT